MSHFYGCVKGNRGWATRGGSKKSGYEAVAASLDGAIEVKLIYDPKTDKNIYIVYQSKWHGKGVEGEIARGIIGEDYRAAYDEGHNMGYDEGHSVGYDQGCQAGHEAGYKEAMGSR